MLITLIGVQFSRSAYESAFYMNVFSYLLLDGMSLLFFKAALSLGKKRRRSIRRRILYDRYAAFHLSVFVAVYLVL